jgi:hypothetical protein
MQSYSDSLHNIALTRDNTILTDGAGSQLQRHYCTYALARFLNIAYIHSPLLRISYHGFSSNENTQADHALVARYNEVFSIPSDMELPQNRTVHHVDKCTFQNIALIQEEAKKTREFHLIKAGFPYPICNKHPEILEWIKTVTPFKKHSSLLFRIAIHVRRGDLLPLDSYRLLPNSYYINTVTTITTILDKLGIPFVCELHTELPKQTFVTSPLDHDPEHQIEKQVRRTKEMNQLKDFEVIPNLKKYIDHDPIETLELMATADLLVISRSSFSYLPATLNKRGIIVYHPFWHAAPKEWIDATHQASFQERIISALLQYHEIL